MKKYVKLLSILLCVTVFLTYNHGIFAYAAQMYTYGQFTYTINGTEAEIVDCEDSGGRITVPSRFDANTVTAIGAFAFMNKSFSGITLPKTVKDIEAGAFMGCAELTQITLPEGVLSIGDNAFYGCSGLESVSVADSVEYIGIDAFEACSDELVISGYTGSYAEEYAQEYGYSFESLGDSEKEALASGVCGENAVWTLSTLGVLTISGSGEMYAESGNTYWTDYTDAVKSIVVEEGITSIMDNAFMNCVEAQIVSLPSTVGKIGSYAFSSCNKLKSIDIKDGVSEIGSYAFYACSSLSTITLPKSVKRIGYSAFERCTSLKSAVLPEGLKTIEDQTFFWCESLSRVVLPESLKTIGVYAFSCCFALSGIKLNDKLTTINESAFSRCSFSEITIPPSVSVIKEGAFSGIEPAPVLKGYDDSTAQSYAEEYGFTFESLGEMPVALIDGGDFGEGLSWEINTLGHLVISGEGASEDFYQSTPAPWASYTVNSIELEEGITYIGKSMFNGLSNIKEVSIPESVKEIAAAAFGGCTSLSSVIMPEGVTDIKSSAFAGCSVLADITIPSTVVYIARESYTARDAFSGCGEGFTVRGYDNTAAEVYADVKGCSFISLGAAPARVIKEGNCDNASDGAVLSYSLTNDLILTINADTACTILSDSDDTTWYEWYGVREIILGNNIQGISSYAFENQRYLERVVFPETILEIESYAFGNHSLDFEVCGYDNTAAQVFAENKYLTFTSLGQATVEVIIAKGVAGDNCTWELNNFGVLTVKGKGEMYDYNRPWDDYREKIKEIVIEKGINSVGSGAFEYAYSADKITVSYTVVRMGSWCIHNDMTVYGFDGSAAQKYAGDMSMSFVSLGNPPANELLIEGSCGDETFWNLTTDGLLTIYGNGSVNYSGWYDFKSLIKKVVVEEGVTYIGVYYAFQNCENLTEATIADSVTYMDSYTFSECPKLKKVKLSKAAAVPYEAFSYCYALEEVIIPQGVTTIGSLSFYDCTALKEITIPASVTDIVSSAFTYCSPELVITGYSGTAAETYTKQYNIAFNSLGAAPLLEEQSGTTGALSWKLTTDNTFTVSGNGAIPDFGWYDNPPWEKYKKYINKIVFEEGVTEIGEYAFEECENISGIEFPSTLVRIGNNAFSGSGMPEKLVFPYGLEEIGAWAFNECPGLKEVEIPETTSIIDDSFPYYDKSFVVGGMSGSKAERYAKSAGYTFKSLGVMERKVIASGECGDYLTYELDNYAQLTINGYGAMWDYEEGCTPWDTAMIETLRMSDDIIYIGDYAFYRAHNLTDIQLPEKLIQIGDYAFADCYEMPFLVLPESVRWIDPFAFDGFSAGIALPQGIEFIGVEALRYIAVYVDKGSYAEEYCSTLSEDMGVRWFYKTAGGKAGANISWSVDAISGILEFTGSGAMYDYVDYDYYYSSTALWTEYMDAVKEIKISEGITYIGGGTMQNIREIGTVKLPSTVTAIGAYAFMNSQISSITIPEACTQIGENAFEFCWKMESAHIPASVESIGEEAFAYCDKLTIYTPAGSAAWNWANERNLPVIATGIETKFNYAYANMDKYYNEIEMEIGGEGLELGKIFCATYDDEGGLLEIKQYGELFGAENVAKVRCFMWEDKESMIPLCKPIDAEIIAVGGNTSTGGVGGSTGTGGSSGSAGTSDGTATGGTSGDTSVPGLCGEAVASGVEAAMEV